MQYSLPLRLVGHRTRHRRLDLEQAMCAEHEDGLAGELDVQLAARHGAEPRVPSSFPSSRIATAPSARREREGLTGRQAPDGEGGLLADADTLVAGAGEEGSREGYVCCRELASWGRKLHRDYTMCGRIVVGGGERVLVYAFLLFEERRYIFLRGNDTK